MADEEKIRLEKVITHLSKENIALQMDFKRMVREAVREELLSQRKVYIHDIKTIMPPY